MVARPLRRVRFLLGRAGSGKTYRCLQEIRQAADEQPLGPPLILLVPEQATYQMERALLMGSSRRATLRCQVVSFRRLSYLALEEQLTRRRVLSELGRQMVVQALLLRGRDQWRFFRTQRLRPGWAAHLSHTLHELRQYRVTPEMLKRASDKLASTQGPDAPLVNKLQDLAVLMEDYAKFLAEKCCDADDIAGMLSDAIRHASWLRGAQLWVDSFGDFTKQEYDLLQALLDTASEATFSLCLDAEALSRSEDDLSQMRLFHRAEETYRRLRQLIPGQAHVEVIKLPSDGIYRRFRNEVLLRVEQEMFHDLIDPAALPQAGEISPRDFERKEAPAPSSCPLTLIEARNRRAEVEYAARTIRQLVQYEGWRYRDIAVVVRRLEDYQGLIEAIFPDYGIPFFTDQRRSLSHHPLVELIRATVRVAAENWRRVDVVRWLRTGLPTHGNGRRGIQEIVDRLEQYADEHGLEGDAWQDRHWRIRRPAGADVPEYLQPEVLNQERLRLLEPLAQFCRALGSEEEVPVRSALEALWRMLERMRVEEALRDWQHEAREAGRFDEAAEHEQAWDRVVQMFEELDLALGAERLSRKDLAAVLETALDSLTLGLVPPVLDEVLVGSIERSRQPELRGVFLLGLNEGTFPLVGDEGAILNDADREVLYQHGIELAPTAETRHYHEQYLGYIAFTRASERLWVSYALADERNHPLLPSPFVERIRRLFPNLQPVRVEGGIGSSAWDKPLTWHELANILARSLREQNQIGPHSPHATAITAPQQILAYLQNTQIVPPAVAMVQRASCYSPYEQNLPVDLAEKLFLCGDELRLSVSELESYAQCPFQFFAGSALRLRARQSFRLSRQDLGELLHRILQFFVQRYIREFFPTDASSLAATGAVAVQDEPKRQQRLHDLLHDAAKAVLDRMEDDRFKATARRQYVEFQALRILDNYVLALDWQFRYGSFIPYRTEMAFGSEEGAEKFSLSLGCRSSDGAERRLVPRGRIDRVDLVWAGGDASTPNLPSAASAPEAQTPSLEKAWLRVVDYKLSPKKLDLDRVYHGLDLQLMIYLLAARDLYGVLTERTCAFYATILPLVKSKDKAPQREEPEEGLWWQAYRLRGIYPEQAAAVLDGTTKAGYSPVVALYRKKDGGLGYRDRTDVVSEQDLNLLADRTVQRLRRIGLEILQGNIPVHPAQHRGQMPCTLCPWMAVCRFEQTSAEGLQRLPKYSRNEVLTRLRGEGPCPT